MRKRRDRGTTLTELLGSLISWPTAGYVVYHLIRYEHWGLGAMGVGVLIYVGVQLAVHIAAAVADHVWK